MQKLYSSKFIGRKFDQPQVNVDDFLSMNGHQPEMFIDEIAHYSEAAYGVFCAAWDQRQKLIDLDKKIGYVELNDFLYPDGAGWLGRYAPLEEFIAYWEDRPKKDWSQDIETAKNSVQRLCAVNRQEASNEYWKNAEAFMQTLATK